MKCPFCDVVENKKEKYKIIETDNFLAIPDSNPILEGHVLLITKEHKKDIYELDEDEKEELGKAIKNTIDLLKKKYGKNVTIYSSNGPVTHQSIKHFHIHLIPRTSDDKLHNKEDGKIKSKIILDRSSGFPRIKKTTEELEKISNELRK